MVRLVFRPYTHVRRTICTSVSLRASIRVSPDFALHKHSSPSFGSRHGCSCEAPFRRNNALPVLLPACLKHWAGVGHLLDFSPRPGLPPKHSHTCQTPWSVFQDGSDQSGTPQDLGRASCAPPTWRRGLGSCNDA